MDLVLDGDLKFKEHLYYLNQKTANLLEIARKI